MKDCAQAASFIGYFLVYDNIFPATLRLFFGESQFLEAYNECMRKKIQKNR